MKIYTDFYATKFSKIIFTPILSMCKLYIGNSYLSYKQVIISALKTSVTFERLEEEE